MFSEVLQLLGGLRDDSEVKAMVDFSPLPAPAPLTEPQLTVLFDGEIRMFSDRNR
jgi:hypothetical protein